MARAAGKGAGRSAAGAAHREHLAALDCLPAPVDALYFVAIVGAERAVRDHLDEAADDRGIGLP